MVRRQAAEFDEVRFKIGEELKKSRFEVLPIEMDNIALNFYSTKGQVCLFYMEKPQVDLAPNLASSGS